jgi:hypothetical protein
LKTGIQSLELVPLSDPGKFGADGKASLSLPGMTSKRDQISNGCDEI